MESGGGAFEEMAGIHASASSLLDHNPFRAQTVFYRFTLEDQKTGATLAQVEYRDAGSRDTMAMRTYPKVVNWDAAGTAVRFVTNRGGDFGQAPKVSDRFSPTPPDLSFAKIPTSFVP